MIRRKKFEVLLGKKKYGIYEPDVGLYLLLLEDSQQFLDVIFQEAGEKLPKLSKLEISKLITELFEVEITEEVLYKKEKENKVIIEDFIITLGKYVKYFGINYEDVGKLPFSFFQKTLKNLGKILSDEKENNDGGPEKDKLRNLLSNFS